MESDGSALLRRDFLKFAAAGPVTAEMALATDRPPADLPRKRSRCRDRRRRPRWVDRGAANSSSMESAYAYLRPVIGLVGGPWTTQSRNGHVVEGGGQWAGPSQTGLLALARDLGVETYKTYTKGKTVVFFSGLRITVISGDRESDDLRRVKTAPRCHGEGGAPRGTVDDGEG